MGKKKNSGYKKRKKNQNYVHDCQVMNIFNIEIMKGINYEYIEKNKIIYLANQPYVRIKVNELKKYSNLKIEKNKMEYKFVSNIKEKKILILFTLKK